MDTLSVMAVLVFFAVSWALVKLCDRLSDREIAITLRELAKESGTRSKVFVTTLSGFQPSDRLTGKVRHELDS